MLDEKVRRSHTALGALEKAFAQIARRLPEGELVKAHPELPDEKCRWEDLVRLAGEHKARAVLTHPTAEEIREVPAPAVVRFKNGNYAMLGSHGDEVVLFIDVAEDKAMAMPTRVFLAAWTGEALVLSPKFTWADFRLRYNLDWFYQVILRYRDVLGEVLLASFFLQAMGILMPLFTQVVIDKVIGNDGLSTLTVLGIAMLVFAFVQSLLSGVRTHIMNQVTMKLDAILGTRLFRRLISLPIPYFERRRVGDVLVRIGMMARIRQFLTGTTLTTILDAVFAVVFVALMLYYSVSLTALALVIVPFFAAQAYFAWPVYHRKMMTMFRARIARQSFLVEAVTGMQTVKALAVEPQFVKRWEKLICRHVQASFDAAAFNQLIGGGNGIIQAVSDLLILWYGGYLVMDGYFTLGQLIAFRMLAAQATGPLVKLCTMWPQVQMSFLALRYIGDILHSRIEPVLQPPAPGLRPLQGAVEVKNLTFRYRLDLPPALTDITFSVKPGERIGIVGRSGSGKSTLAGLLEKIYFPDEGELTIDGTDIRHADYSWLRGQMGVVMQDSYLFNGSIRENIAAGRPAAPMEDVMQAARLAGAHEFILELDEGYDTRVGERGAGLSGGQRQRIAIARALLTNPRVLIFDEATSALDYESERIVMNNIEHIAKGRTMFIIAHRLVTVEHCDRILVLDHGRLVEQGTPQELLALGGIYANLHQQQTT